MARGYAPAEPREQRTGRRDLRIEDVLESASALVRLASQAGRLVRTWSLREGAGIYSTDRSYPVEVAVPRTVTAGPAAGEVFGVVALVAGEVTARGRLVASGVGATAFGVTVTFVKVEYTV